MSQTTSKSVEKKSLTFQSIDLSRFTEIYEVPCLPISFGRNSSKTKLMCRHCGVHIGYGYKDGRSAQCGFHSRIGPDRSYKKIVAKIGALQPLDVVNEGRNGNGRNGSGQNGSSH